MNRMTWCKVSCKCTCNLCIGIDDPTQANWIVSEAGDPDMVSGDSIMFICTPQSLAIPPINFHKSIRGTKILLYVPAKGNSKQHGTAYEATCTLVISGYKMMLHSSVCMQVAGWSRRAPKYCVHERDPGVFVLTEKSTNKDSKYDHPDDH
jgi:hypothetical protein